MGRTRFHLRGASLPPRAWTIVPHTPMSAVRPLCLALLLITFASTLGRSAAADVSNRNLVPFGERAAFLGNAGITSEQGDAVFYNPANLARIGHPNLSVSANVYAVVDLKADPLLVIEGEEQPFEASGFLSIPSSLVSTYQIGGWALATAVLVPEALALKNRLTFDSPSLHVTLLQAQEQESLYLGAGAARQIVPGLVAGLSVFVAKETVSDLQFVRSEVVADPPVVSEFISNSDTSVFNLTAVAGVFWQASARLGIGARVQVPPIRLKGSADIYQSILVPGDDMLTSEDEWEDVNASAPLPWDLGVGVSLQATRKIELVADFNVQLPDTLTTIDEPDIEEIGTVRVKTELAPRVGVGAEWEFLSQAWLRLGALYNRSAFREPETASDEAQEHYYGVTGGLAWQKDRTHTAIGAFYLRSDVNVLVDGTDPPRQSDARALLYGALLTVSYRL